MHQSIFIVLKLACTKNFVIHLINNVGANIISDFIYHVY